MRYFRIFLIYFEEAFEYRSRSLVWFSISLINPLILLIYWIGYYKSQSNPFFSINSLSMYYLLLIIATALLMPHVEETIAFDDIQQGGLTKFLLKPASYTFIRFIGEIPWRVVQGFFGLVVFIVFLFLFGSFLQFSLTWQSIFLGILVSLLAYLLSFFYKLTIGYTAFWLIEFSGLNEVLGVITLIFAGYVMPIELFPDMVRNIAYILPFPYMIYFPIVVFQGNKTVSETIWIISAQVFWIILFYILSKILFKNGIKKYMGLGD